MNKKDSIEIIAAQAGIFDNPDDDETLNVYIMISIKGFDNNGKYIRLKDIKVPNSLSFVTLHSADNRNENDDNNVDIVDPDCADYSKLVIYISYPIDDLNTSIHLTLSDNSKLSIKIKADVDDKNYRQINNFSAEII